MTTPLTIYTLKTCDTCRKALAWLKEQGVEHTVVDVRADGVPREDIKNWVDVLGWEVLLNRRSTTWRGLSDDQTADMTADKAVELMDQNPTLIKRPVWDVGETLVVGFGAAQKQELSKLW